MVGEHWVGTLRWLGLVIDFHCHGVGMLCWVVLIDEMKWRRVVVFCPEGLVDEGMVGAQSDVCKCFDGGRRWNVLFDKQRYFVLRKHWVLWWED